MLVCFYPLSLKYEGYFLVARYMPFAGFHGVLAGLLVGIKQIIPDQEVLLVKIKAKVIIFLAF